MYISDYILSPVAEDLRVAAAAINRVLEVVHVQPVVGRVLDSTAHRHSLVLSPVVARVRVMIENRRPEQRAASLRLDGNIEAREVSLAALVVVVQVPMRNDPRPRLGGCWIRAGVGDAMLT